MAIGWSAFYTDLTANIDAAWPEVAATGGGVWELNDAERSSYLRTTATLPIAIFEVTASPSADWGLVNSVYEVEVEVYYVAEMPAGTGTAHSLDAIRTKIDALRAQLLHVGNVTTATVLDVTMLDWTGHNPALSMFYDKNISFVAGALQATFVIGETIQ
jgi:hypothetical protein